MKLKFFDFVMGTGTFARTCIFKNDTENVRVCQISECSRLRYKSKSDMDWLCRIFIISSWPPTQAGRGTTPPISPPRSRHVTSHTSTS